MYITLVMCVSCYVPLLLQYLGIQLPYYFLSKFDKSLTLKQIFVIYLKDFSADVDFSFLNS